MRLVRDDREAKRFWTCRVETRASPASVHSFCYPVASCLFWLLTQRCHFALIEAKGSEGDWGISWSCLLYQKEPAISHVGAACQSHQKMISCPCNVMLVVPRTAVSLCPGGGRERRCIKAVVNGAGLTFFSFLSLFIFLISWSLHCWARASSSCIERELLSRCAAQASRCGGFSCRARAQWHMGFSRWHSQDLYHGLLRCMSLVAHEAGGIFLGPIRGSDPCPLYWQSNSQPLNHQGSLVADFVFNLFIFNWRIIALQFWFDFCHTSTWISLRCTCVSSLLNLPPTPLLCCRAPVWVPWVTWQIPFGYVF